MLRCLDHVILAVRDLAAATRQYAQLLGRNPSWRGEHPNAGTENTLFRLENTYLELLAPTSDGPTARAVQAWLEARGEGLLGLAFGTEDADACRGFFAERDLDPEPVEKGVARDLESGAFREWRRVPLPLARTRGVVLFAIEHTSPEDALPMAAALGDERISVCALDHAVVRTPDGEAAKALYRDGLGLRLALDREFPKWGARLLFFRLGGVTIELAAGLGSRAGSPDSSATGGGAASSGDPSDTDRLWGLAWCVRDAEGARARLAEAGFEVSKVRDGRKPGTRVFTVRDGTCAVPTLMLEPETS